MNANITRYVEYAGKIRMIEMIKLLDQSWKEFRSFLKNHLSLQVDWCLYVSVRNIFLMLSYVMFNLQANRKLTQNLLLECGLLDKVNLFDLESEKSHDSEEFLYRTAKKWKPTLQENVVSKILDDFQLRYMTQWILCVKNRHSVFDFLVEPNMIIECTFTEREPSSVIAWLHGRALILDNKFKTLKTSVAHDTFTLMFLESTRLHPTKLKAAIQDLDYTDRLVTSINQFEAFMGEWKQYRVAHGNKIIKPTVEAEVPSWAVNDPQSTLERFI